MMNDIGRLPVVDRADPTRPPRAARTSRRHGGVDARNREEQARDSGWLSTFAKLVRRRVKGNGGE